MTIGYQQNVPAIVRVPVEDDEPVPGTVQDVIVLVRLFLTGAENAAIMSAFSLHVIESPWCKKSVHGLTSVALTVKFLGGTQLVDSVDTYNFAFVIDADSLNRSTCCDQVGYRIG